MKQISFWRLGFIAAVLLATLAVSYPSAIYYLALRKADPEDGLIADVEFSAATADEALRTMLETGGFTVDRIEALPAPNTFALGVNAVDPYADEAGASRREATKTKLFAILEETFGEEGYEVVRTRSFWQEERARLQERAIPLGLDLRGGVDVTLRIDDEQIVRTAVQELVTTLRDVFRDEKINIGIRANENESGILLELEDRNDARQVFNILSGYTSLTGDYSSERLGTLEEFELGIDESQLETDLTATIDAAIKIIRERLDQYGLSQPIISKQGTRHIRIQIPAAEGNPSELLEKLTQLATMEFRLAREDYLTPADPINQLLDADGELIEGYEDDVPIGSEVLRYKFGTYDPKTQLITYDEGWMLARREILMTGSNLRATRVIQVPTDFTDPNQVWFQFDAEGKKKFGDVTLESSAKHRRGAAPDHLVVIIDNIVRSAPVMEQAITGGSGVIRGGFSFEEARDLSLLLKGGSLPAPLKIEHAQTVRASLGNESILAGVQALGWGTFLVVVFMIFYYGMAGVIAVFALGLNVLIILAVMALWKATLTLSGIGGIMLTVGMAVDANVLIYERIREEIDGGRPLRQSISTGFDRAFTVILDSNLTTLMTALVLLQFTSGAVFGFALTMTFGLIANLFTGLFVTSSLCTAWFQWRDRLSLGRLRPFAKSMFDFIKLRYVTGAISAALLIGGIAFLVPRGGLVFGVDFVGGMLTTVRFERETNEDELRTMLADAALEGAMVQAVVGDENDYILKVKGMTVEGREEIDFERTGAVLEGALTQVYGEDFTILETAEIGSETGQTFRTMAITVMILASIAILCYLWLRFELIFGVAAVIALLHDLALTGIWASVWGVEITLPVVAALMVLLGFSVNDTIVIFDRIRENSRKHANKPFREICNLSMNQSLSRTLITSGTAILVIVIMLQFGGEGLRPFAQVLLLGSIFGTYSSDFIAAPIVFEWNRRRKGGLATALAKKKSPGPEEARVPEKAGSGRTEEGAVATARTRMKRV